MRRHAILLFLALAFIATATAGPMYEDGEVVVRLHDGTHLVLREDGYDTPALLERLRNDPGVDVAEPNWIYLHQSTVPDDPGYPQQWALPRIGAPDAWDVTTGDRDVVVAVIDSGIDYLHEDLAANMWRSPDPATCTDLTDEELTWLEGEHGFDFAVDDDGSDGADPMDIDGHGTHIAGVIGAVGNNAIGIAGVNWRVSLIAVKAMRPDQTFRSSDTLQAYAYVRMLKEKCGVNIVAVNASYGARGGGGELARDAIEALGEAGIAFVAAAGNDGTDNDSEPFFPANYDVPNMVAVTAIDQDDGLAEFSNHGYETVHLAAPGVGILSTTAPWEGRGEVVHDGDVFDASVLVFSRGAPAGITAELHDCGFGLAPDDCPPGVDGALALIERGQVNFSDKVANAREAGAVGVVIFNSESGGDNTISGTLGGPGDWLPTVGIGRSDGLTLRAAGTPTVTLRTLDAYGAFSGTSSATALVSGALALVAARHTGDDTAVRIDRVLSGTVGLDALSDRVLTGGALSLPHAIRDLRLNRPVRPGRLFLAADAGDHVRLTWTSRSTNADGFVVERRDGGGAFAEVGRVDADVFAFDDTGVEAGRFHAWRVRAFNDAGLSIEGREVQRVPTLVSGSVVDGRLVAGERHVYRLVSSVDRRSLLVELQQPQSGVTLRVRRGVEPTAGDFDCEGPVCEILNPGSSTWYFAVTADVAEDYRLAVWLAPPAPSAFSVAARDGNQVQLTWNPDIPDAQFVQIDRRASTDTPFIRVAEVAPHSGGYLDSGLQDGTTYEYRIRAVGVAGPSFWSPTRSVTARNVVTPPPEEQPRRSGGGDAGVSLVSFLGLLLLCAGFRRRERHACA